jgi:hypothetical protein
LDSSNDEHLPKLFRRIQRCIGAPTLANLCRFFGSFLNPIDKEYLARSSLSVEDALLHAITTDNILVDEVRRQHPTVLQEDVAWWVLDCLSVCTSWKTTRNTSRLNLEHEAERLLRDNPGTLFPELAWERLPNPINQHACERVTVISDPPPNFFVLGLAGHEMLDLYMTSDPQYQEWIDEWVLGSGFFRGLIEQGVDPEAFCWRFHPEPRFDPHQRGTQGIGTAAMLLCIRNGDTIITEINGEVWQGTIVMPSERRGRRSGFIYHGNWDAIAMVTDFIVIWGKQGNKL